MKLEKSIQDEITEKLKSLDPEQIIIFGSYANGTARPGSDIDLFIVKEIKREKVRESRLRARKYLREIIFKYKIGIDVFVDNQERMDYRINQINDQFYSEIRKNGIVIYAK